MQQQHARAAVTIFSLKFAICFNKRKFKWRKSTKKKFGNTPDLL